MFGLLQMMRIIEVRQNAFYYFYLLSHSIYPDSIIPFLYSFQSLPPPNPHCPITTASFSLQKKKQQTSQGYQPNKSYQGAIILGTNSYFKAIQDQGNRRKRDLKTDERFRDAMTPTFKSFTNTPS